MACIKMVKIKEMSCFVMLVISSVIGQQEGDDCIFARTASAGTCVKIDSCRAAITNIRRGIGPQFCGDGEIGPTLVCCDSGNPPKTAATITTAATTTTAATINTYISPGQLEDRCPPLPAKTGQKSWDYCIDMANTIFGCNNSPTLGGSREPKGLCSNYADNRRQRRNTRSRRVVGGVPAGKNDFPHMALLIYGEAADTATGQCGGTLINKRWVLTTAHCASGRPIGVVKSVLLGSPNRSAPLDRKMLFDIKKIVEHPTRSAPVKYDDIALLQLDRDATFGPAVIPACLHVDPTVNINKAFITGWGVTSILKYNEPPSDVLQKVELEEFPHAECSGSYPPTVNLAQGIDNATQICYGSRTDAKGTCQGDAGGPAQIPNKSVYCTYTIVGLLSFGKRCGIVGIPDVYSRVAAYVPWIESIAWP